MLFLLDKDVRTVKWNGIPLHEASSAIVKEETNSDFYLTVRYPITDSGIYHLIKEDMLIKAPTPVLGAQLFRIKKPIENDDSLDITAYHISDDIMKRSIKPVSVVGQGCAMALSQMVQNAKTGLGDFSFASDIIDSRTFNTAKTETLYSVLMDGKHSIVGTWEGELVRDNFALSIKRSRGADRGVVITTHKNLKSYQRTKNSQNVVTRIHARSTLKPEGAEEETKLSVTVDSPLINSYPYINEKEYENNNARTTDELRKWAEAKFKNEGIDKVSDAIEIEAYELDGQVVHLGDTVNLKSRKHSADIYKKAIAYEFNALTEKYISITFDDKPGVGGSGVSSGLSNVANAILEAGSSAQSIEISRAIANANQAFDAEFEKKLTNINDGIERVKSDAQAYADSIRQDINQQFDKFNESYEAEQAKQDQAVKEVLTKATSAENLASQAKSISDQAKLDAVTALSSAQTAKNEAIEEAQRLDTVERQDTETKLAAAKSQAITEASRLVNSAKSELSERLLSAETEITKTTDEIKTLAKKSELDTVNDRLSSAESSFTQMSDKITTEISRIEGKIPDNVGAVNLLKNGTFENESRHWEPVGLDDKVFADFTASAKRYAGRAGLLIKNDPYRTITEGTRGFKQTIIGPFNPSEKLTFSADLAYTGGDFGGMTLKVIYKSATDAITGEFSHTFRRADMTTGYRRFTKTIELPRSYIPKIDVIIAAEDGKVADIYITRAQLERGTIATDYSKSIDELDFDIETVKTTITQTAEGVKQLSTKVTENDSKISNAETKINQVVGEVSSKVSQTDFNKLNNIVSSQATTLSQQANQILLKADKSYVDNVNKLVSQNSASLSMLSDAIEARVLKSDFDSVTGRVTSAETTIKTIAGQIDTKLSRTDADKIVTNAITQSERGTIQRISEVEGKIPTEVGGVNLLLNSDFSQTATGNSFTVNNQTYNTTALKWTTYNGGLTNATTSYHAYVANLNGRKNAIIYNETNGERNWKGISQILDDRMPQTTNDFILSLDVLVSGSGTKLFGGFYYYDISGNRNFNAGQFQFDTKNFEISKWQRVSIAVPFNKERADFSREVRFYIYAYNFTTNAILAIDDVKLEAGKIATGHSLAFEELATTAAVHEIRQTVDGYSRTISEQGKSISQVLQTAQGLVSRVENLSIGSRNLLKGTKDLSTTDRPQYVTTDKYLDFAIARSNTEAGVTHDTFRARTTTSLTATEYVATFYARASRDGAVVLNHFFSPNSTLTGISSTNPMRTAADGAVYLTLTTEWKRYWIKWTQTPTDSPKTVIIGRNQSSTAATVEIAGVALYEGNTPQDWSPAHEDSEVPLNAVKTEVSQLAGSWAVKNLTSAGTVLNQINLMANGTNRIDGRLTHITGSTLIDNAVIKSAMVDKLTTANLSSSSVTTDILAARAVTGDKISFDQAFFNNLTANEAYLRQLFAKNAFITQVQSVTMSANQISGGVLKALNNAMEIQLNTGQILYYTDQAALKRILPGYPTQFIKFETGEFGSRPSGVTVIGSNRNGTESTNDGGFVGIRAWNGTGADALDLVGDHVRLVNSAYDSAGGWTINTLSNQLEIDAYNANHRRSSKVKVGDVWLWSNASTYSSLRDTINSIIDNLYLLHNNKTTERAYSYAMPAKV